MTRTSPASLTSSSPETPATYVSRRWVWVGAFLLACSFWATVAALAGLAIHEINKNRQAHEAAASRQAE